MSSIFTVEFNYEENYVIGMHCIYYDMIYTLWCGLYTHYDMSCTLWYELYIIMWVVHNMIWVVHYDMSCTLWCGRYIMIWVVHYDVQITKKMEGVTKGLDKAMKSMDLEKVNIYFLINMSIKLHCRKKETLWLDCGSNTARHW